MPDSDEFSATYTIEAEQGSGGMGTVYRATDKMLGRTVAIKTLKEFQDTETGRKRFMREIKVLSQLEHPNIVQLYSGGFSKHDAPFIVMEWIEGQTLAQYLSIHGSLQIGEAKNIFTQILSAAEYAHSKGIVHRDISPENIVLVQGQNQLKVKLLDFGLARSFVDVPTEMKLTGTGMILGNASYMSPEQCRAEPLGPQADIYSIACVLFQCLTGAAPFQGGGALELMYKHINEQPDYSNLPDSSELRGIMELCLCKDPNKRIANAGELSSKLDACFDKLSSAKQKQAESSEKIPFHKVIVPVICVVLLAVSLVLCTKYNYFLPQSPPVEEHHDPNQLADMAQAKYIDALTNFDADRMKLFVTDLKEAIQLNELAAKDIEAALTTEKLSNGARRRLMVCRHRVYLQLGVANQLAGDPKESRRYYELAIKFNTDQSFAANSTAMRSMALMLEMSGMRADAKNILAKVLTEKPDPNNPEELKMYADTAADLSCILSASGMLDESTKDAELCLNTIEEKKLIDPGFQAEAYAIIAQNAKTKGNDPQFQKASAAAKKLLLNANAIAMDQSACASACAILAETIYDKEKTLAKSLFLKAIYTYGTDCKVFSTLARAIDLCAETCIAGNDLEFVETEAKKLLAMDDKLVRNPLVRATCLKALAQLSFERGRAPDSRTQEDKKCGDYLNQAVETSQKSLEAHKLIAVELLFLKGRLRLRQSKTKTGVEQAEERINAASHLEKSSFMLLANYDYWRRKTVQQCAAEYLNLLIEHHDVDKAERLKDFIAGSRWHFSERSHKPTEL